MTQIGLRVSGIKIQLTRASRFVPGGWPRGSRTSAENIFWIEAQENEDERIEGDHVADQVRDGETGKMAFEPVE